MNVPYPRRTSTQIVSKDRELLTSRMEAARREQANGTPLNQVTIQQDCACQIRYALGTVHPQTHASERQVIWFPLGLYSGRLLAKQVRDTRTVT